MTFDEEAKFKFSGEQIHDHEIRYPAVQTMFFDKRLKVIGVFFCKYRILHGRHGNSRMTGDGR